uniref:Uncharacterized protein n=1 Tax=Anguilla anguilla TaxID=7936 RepID=A0A0E9QU71_ANGAN
MEFCVQMEISVWSMIKFLVNQDYQ